MPLSNRGFPVLATENRTRCEPCSYPGSPNHKVRKKPGVIARPAPGPQRRTDRHRHPAERVCRGRGHQDRGLRGHPHPVLAHRPAADHAHRRPMPGRRQRLRRAHRHGPQGHHALRAFRTAVEEYGAGIFDTEIPLREDFKADFGHTFRSNLNGYEDVWNELKEELR